MYISTSNILTDSNVSVTLDASGSIPKSYMLNSDFSEIYRSGTTQTAFRIVLDVVGIKYIGLAGLDVFGVCSSIDFEYWNGSAYVIDKSYIVTSNATIMHINLLHQAATKWRISFNKTFSNLRVGIAYLAAGNFWDVPYGGENAGYLRPWSTPAYKQRTQNNLGAPTSTVIESLGINCTLSLDNISTDDVINIWSPLQGFAVTDGVFINEDPNQDYWSYYCYNCSPTPVAAHSQTRSLQNVSMKFAAWTGRTI